MRNNCYNCRFYKPPRTCLNEFIDIDIDGMAEFEGVTLSNYKRRVCDFWAAFTPLMKLASRLNEKDN